MKAGARTPAGAAMATAALLLATTACGLPGVPGLGGHKATRSPATAPARRAGPMAKMPPGTRLSLVHKGRLTVCEGPAGTPFMFAKGNAVPGIGVTGKVQGFDVDMLSLVGQRIGAVPVVVTFGNTFQLFDGVPFTEKFCDVIGGTAMDDPKFFPKVSPSIGYFRRDSAIVTAGANRFASRAQLAGKRVGAVGGGSGFRDDLDTYNAQHGNTIHVQRMADSTMLIHLLQTGSADAVVLDNAAAMYQVTRNPGLHVTGEFGQVFQERFAVRKGNAALLAQINAALVDAGRNGLYAKSYHDWFGTDPTAVPPA